MEAAIRRAIAANPTVVDAVIAAGLTSFYSWRLIFKTFHGEPHDRHHYDAAHEAPMWILVPIGILAGIAAGYLPWFNYQSRTIYTFYAVAFVPYVVLAVTYVLGLVIGFVGVRVSSALSQLPGSLNTTMSPRCGPLAPQ